jgi:transketolase
VSRTRPSLAGHLGLGKLIVLYDDNHITLDAASSVSFDEDVLERYDAYHWHTQRVEDGNDASAIAAAMQKAKEVGDRPSIIAVRTIIGYGAPDKQGTHEAHGSPLGDEEAAAAKRNLGIDWPEFTVPEDVLALYREAVSKGAEAEQKWNDLYQRYQEAFPDEAAEFAKVMRGEVPGGLEPKLPHFAVGDKGQATRNASNKAIGALAPLVPQLMGGSADLSGSTKTTIEGEPFIERGDYGGRNLYFGVREHAMAAAANGMALHEGVRPFVGTFLIFSDYLRPSLRLAALMELPVIYVFSHDSIGLGGDGPTHQPIGQLMALRAIPNATLIRPADANETQQAWIWAVAHKNGPVAFALTRQSVPNLKVPEGAVDKGAYVLSDCEGTPQVILIGTGSEVQLCLGAQELLQKENIRARVVSLPSFEIFDAQDEGYRESVLPQGIKARVAVEAGATLGWQKYVGLEGATVTLDHFGASAEGEVVMEKFGFTPENVAGKARALI